MVQRLNGRHKDNKTCALSEGPGAVSVTASLVEERACFEFHQQYLAPLASRRILPQAFVKKKSRGRYVSDRIGTEEARFPLLEED